MDQKSSSKSFLEALNASQKSGSIPEKYVQILEEFYKSYHEVTKSLHSKDVENLFMIFLSLMEEQFRAPYEFEPYHKQIRSPFDYYQFGNDLFKPLIDLPHSTLKGETHLMQIEEALKNGHNVVLFANHQVEADPHAISILLEKNHPNLGSEMIFVAGDRVVTDPLAIPFSMGRNLLCIYSKKYIDTPPEKKLEKQMHNKRTMQLMSELLSEGGHAIYVAPSGGRDRKNKEGVIEIEEFDPQSIEMFYLMAKKSKTPTHFYPLALSTYSLMPPPEERQIELGESRKTEGGAIHITIGNEIDMEHFPGEDEKDKHKRRKNRADYIWNLVRSEYDKFPI